MASIALSWRWRLHSEPAGEGELFPSWHAVISDDDFMLGSVVDEADKPEADET